MVVVGGAGIHVVDLGSGTGNGDPAQASVTKKKRKVGVSKLNFAMQPVIEAGGDSADPV